MWPPNREISGGGVAASFDGVGAASWPVSLASVRPRGTILSFGNASGPVTGVALGALASAGSLYVTRPRLWDYYATPAESADGVARLFDMLESGAVKCPWGRVSPCPMPPKRTGRWRRGIRWGRRF
jgi:NADPH2:quinone reductase